MVETRAGGKHELDLGNIKEDIIAEVGDTYDLGSEDKNWAAIWVAIAMVTSIVIGGTIAITNVDGVLFINASTEINGSLNISEDLFVNGTLTAGNLDVTNLTVENMNFTNLTITGDVFNISTDETYINALFPNEYCTSDLGSSALRWRNIYVCGNITAGYFYGDGSNLTNLPAVAELDPYWTGNFTLYNSSWSPQAELDPYWTGNFTLYNSSWSSTYNATYDAKISFPGWDENIAWQNRTNNFTANQNLTAVNITAISCIIFDSGGTICSGV